MSASVLSVAEFVRALKSLVANHGEFQNVAVVGEISNFNAHHSGHFYFSLKDKDARISCVMFKSKSSRVLFKPKNGDKVVIMGYCDVFESNGSVQIYAERMNLDGLGDLHIQYEALKKSYLAKGYFDVSHKKELVSFPKRIAVITGKDSAAYADISRTLSSRWPMAEQIDLFAYVQGEYAVDSLVSQIEAAQSLGVDAILLARGGGSIEDLWAFNEERVVEAIFNSSVVVVSGIGHESDTTLADFVADYRAATPTGAAVALTPDVKDIYLNLRDYKNRFYLGFKARYNAVSSEYLDIINRSHLKNPQHLLDTKQQNLDYLQARIVNQLKRLDFAKDYLIKISQANQFALVARINREKNALQQFNQHIISHTHRNLTKQEHRFESMHVRLGAQGRYLSRNVHDAKQVILQKTVQINAAIKQELTLNQRAFNDIIKSLDLLSPLKIMGRGYALAYHDNDLIRSIDDVSVGSEIKVRLKDGSLISRVEKREQNHE